MNHATIRPVMVLAMSVAISPCDGQNAPLRPTLADVLPYAGSYRAGPGQEIVIYVQPNTPMGPMLVLSDLGTDEVRVLFPAARDSFVAGPELVRPAPEQFAASFVRDGTGVPSAVRLAGAWFGAGVVAQRNPVRTTALQFRNGSVSLEGTIYLPALPSRTAIVLANGSEDNDRHSFGDLPYILANHGLVVLAYDKRGTGESGGSWQDAGLDQLADDLLAGVAALRARPDLRIDRVGIIGTSEGGWVAPLAASRTSGIAFIAAISGGSSTKGETFIYKDRRRAEEQGLSGAALDSVVRSSRQIIEASRKRVAADSAPTGFDRRVTYDPTEDWQKFRGPILSLGGEFDVLEDATQSADRLRRILLDAGHGDFTIKVFPRAHHMLFVGATGLPSEFAAMRGIHSVAPGYRDVLLRWLERVAF